MGIRRGTSHAYARNLLKRYKENVSAEVTETIDLPNEFCKELLPPPRINSGQGKA